MLLVGFSLHAKGLQQYARNVGAATKIAATIPATATQTLTKVKTSCRDHADWVEAELLPW
jgi:hypothetical protein